MFCCCCHYCSSKRLRRRRSSSSSRGGAGGGSFMIPWFHTKWGLLKKVQHSVVSAHVLGSLLLPLFSMNLPIQKKTYGCTCHFNIASPTGTAQEQNSLHKIRLHN